MLFDIDNDPHELDNLVTSRPDVLGEGVLKLDQWVGEQLFRAAPGDPFFGITNEGGPLRTNTNLPTWYRYLRRLQQTDRGHHADALERLQGQLSRIT